MVTAKTNIFLKAAVLVTFLVMIFVNAMANILPINGVNTGEISNYYHNLFAPAAITFSIWGLIYLLLAGYTCYQLVFPRLERNAFDQTLFKKISIYFIISSVANALWILTWHYQVIPLSMLLMIIILVSLIMINQETSKREYTRKENIFVRSPFSIYFGWITVATIANATVLLVDMGWKGFGISETFWTIIIILVGLIIGVSTMLGNKDVWYGLVIIWAYLGILNKHVSASGFNWKYPPVIYTVILAIIILVISLAYNIYTRAKFNR